MKIKHIHIGSYKNLKNFDCEFSDSNISAFIGNNGSGKSNLLEAISQVFSTAKNVAQRGNSSVIYYLDIKDCHIHYESNGIEYVLNYDETEASITHDGKELSLTNMDKALPETIMLYYAGETRRQRDVAQSSIDKAYENKLKKIDNAGFPGFKSIDIYSAEDLPALLLVAAIYKGSYYNQLMSLLGCKEISLKTTLSLKNPSGKGDGKAADTYWGARGFVKSFLDELRRYVSKTIDMHDLYYMVFDDVEPFMKTSSNEGELFAKFKALSNAGYLLSLTLELQRNDGDSFSWEELSEGEKQLSLLLLLTSFTSQNHCLYLFDEFDAYLHLNWQRDFSQVLRDLNIQGHVIFTTHSPSSISKLKSDELFIMKNGTVEYPGSETYNRALDEIMLEQMDVSMHSPEIEKLYGIFKQCIADRNRSGAEKVMQELKVLLDESDPLFDRMKLNLRRI